jgi:hypothetical protein
MACFKEYVTFKMNIVKEIKKAIEENELMTDELSALFKNKLLVVEEKVVTKERKKRDGPSEHNIRVQAGMVQLKERYPYVAHKIRLGTANYASTYSKENPQSSMEECIAFAIKKMHEIGKYGDVYDAPPPPTQPPEDEVNHENSVPSSSSDESKKQKKTKDPVVKAKKDPAPKKKTKKQMKEEEEEEAAVRKKVDDEKEKTEDVEVKQDNDNDTQESFSDLDSESEDDD